MRHNNRELEIQRVCRKAMQDAGIYEARYESQIEHTAHIKAEMESIEAELRKSGMTITTVGSMGQTKTELHPMYQILKDDRQQYPTLLAALGLNKLQEKKSEAREAKKEKDGVMDFLKGR